MTAPAISEALENRVYQLVVEGKHYRWVSNWLMKEHGVSASPSAVQSCIRRVKAEKDATALDLCEGDIEGGVAVLDGIYRESRVLALRAAEKGNIAGGMRALEHQLRVVRVHCDQVRQAAKSARTTLTAPLPDPDNTLTDFRKGTAYQGLTDSCQGVAPTPTAASSAELVAQPEPPSSDSASPPKHTVEEMKIAIELAAQLDRVIDDQKAKLAERQAREAADPQLQGLRRNWAGDHFRPPRL